MTVTVQLHIVQYNTVILQCSLIRTMMFNKYKDLKGIEILKAYEIQGM